MKLLFLISILIVLPFSTVFAETMRCWSPRGSIVIEYSSIRILNETYLEFTDKSGNTYITNLICLAELPKAKNI
jgi:hypothetical protein